MKYMLKLLSDLENSIEDLVRALVHRRRVASYLNSDRRPWRKGYSEYRNKYLRDVLNNKSLLKRFRDNSPLPDTYGYRLDARVVEVPWVLARLTKQKERVLDAGSSLNHDFILKAPALASKKVTIFTLAPEPQCYWRLGISYVYGDLRDLDFQDNWFDTIVCISTIEHVGMDNTRYAGDDDTAQAGDTKEWLLAIKELKRVLKPDGVLYITFPFGKYENHVSFQQVDSDLTDKLIEKFDPCHFNESVYRYDPDGWKLGDRCSCANCEYFDVRTSKYFDTNSTIEYPSDYPAGERAVACLELFK